MAEVKCARCGSDSTELGFTPSVTGDGCTFCDGTAAGLCPWCQEVHAQEMVCDEDPRWSGDD